MSHSRKLVLDLVGLSCPFVVVAAPILENEEVVRVQLVFPVNAYVLNLRLEVVLVFFYEHCKPDCFGLTLASISLYLVRDSSTYHCKASVLRVAETICNDALDFCVTRCVWSSTSLCDFDLSAVLRERLAWLRRGISLLLRARS